MTPKMAMFAPIPRASETMATMVKPGLSRLDQGFILPDVNQPASILIQAQQPVAASHVRGVPESTEVEDCPGEIKASLARGPDGVLHVCQIQTTEVAIHLVLGRAFGKQADHVDLLTGGDLEAGKHHHAVRLQEAAQSVDRVHATVVGDADNFDVERRALVEQLLVVTGFV